MVPSISIRSGVSDGVIAASQVKVAVAEYYANEGSLPNDNAAIGLKKADWAKRAHVKNLTVGQGGTITVVFQNLGFSELESTTLVFVPQPQGDSLLRSHDLSDFRRAGRFV